MNPKPPNKLRQALRPALEQAAREALIISFSVTGLFIIWAYATVPPGY